jgi:hypothetical protein
MYSILTHPESSPRGEGGGGALPLLYPSHVGGAAPAQLRVSGSPVLWAPITWSTMRAKSLGTSLYDGDDTVVAQARVRWPWAAISKPPMTSPGGLWPLKGI